VYAIKACAFENLYRNYKNRNIYMLSDSQAEIKTLGKCHITSELVWGCHQSLIQLAKHNSVQLIWVSGHGDIVGNETADQLARTGSEHQFIGPEPACGISVGVAKKAARDWTNTNHKRKHWESVIGFRQVKGTYTRALCQKNK
jgi:ribonuclease HI